MNTTLEHTVTESRSDAIRRLLKVARESGVKLLKDDRGEMWATSVSEPGLLHKVEPESCSCRGFTHHRRCRHVAALWAHLGFLDPNPDPASAALPDCPVCLDAGLIDAPRSRWVGGCRTGYRDQWTTAVPCPSCQPVAA